MARKPKRTCQQCRDLFADGTRCPNSKGPTAAACKKFRPGRPYRPKFHGQRVQDVEFDPDVPQAFSFWHSDDQCLMLAWEVDHNGYGYYRLFLLGFDSDGVVTKKFTKRKKMPAFYGEVRVKGPGQNDLWASSGFEDPDATDLEGNTYNKPREVELLPKRND